MRIRGFMKKIRLIIITILIIVLLFPKYEIYEDGGTKAYTSLAYKLILWNEIEGKQGMELYFFPRNFYNLSYCTKSLARRLAPGTQKPPL